MVLIFQTLPALTLKFYKNGMILQKSQLRPYDDPSTQAFLKDIFDGYFPSELQCDYPNGVPFKVLFIYTYLLTSFRIFESEI